jgi:hypothetical protein
MTTTLRCRASRPDPTGPVSPDEAADRLIAQADPEDLEQFADALVRLLLSTIRGQILEERIAPEVRTEPSGVPVSSAATPVVGTSHAPEVRTEPSGVPVAYGAEGCATPVVGTSHARDVPTSARLDRSA